MNPTKEPITWIGETGFHLTKNEIKELRKLIQLMAESTGRKAHRDEWKSIAARPKIAKHWLTLFWFNGPEALEIIRREAEPKDLKRN